MPNRVGVFSERPDLVDRLREACPEWEFVASEERRSCRIAIVDAGGSRPVGKSVVRLLLTDGEVDARQHSRGELVIDRNFFLSTPANFLAFAADAAAAAIDASRLEMETASLRQIQDLMALTDEESVSAAISDALLGIAGGSRATLLLHDPRLERFVVSYNSDPDYRDTGELVPGLPPDLLQKAIASPELFAAGPGADGRPLLVMPLRVEDDLLGVVRIPLESPEAQPGDEAAAALTKYLRAVAQVVSNVYQLTRSRDLAMRDDLTKAFNRRFFETYLDEEIERSRRYGTLLSIIFLDLDELKSVNNLYGHLAGSRTLQEVAKRILGAVRGIDKVVRFGGDEFCVILPQTDQEQAIAVANRISRSVSTTPLHIDESIEVSITASFGIATYPTHAVAKEALIRQADAAMYRVKSTTKNAVGVADGKTGA